MLFLKEIFLRNPLIAVQIAQNPLILNINDVNCFEMSGCQLAALQGQHNVLIALMAHNADFNQRSEHAKHACSGIQNAARSTPLALAIQAGHAEIIDTLVLFGATDPSVTVSELNSYRKRINVTLVERILHWIIKYGAEINALTLIRRLTFPKDYHYNFSALMNLAKAKGYTATINTLNEIVRCAKPPIKRFNFDNLPVNQDMIETEEKTSAIVDEVTLKSEDDIIAKIKDHLLNRSIGKIKDEILLSNQDMTTFKFPDLSTFLAYEDYLKLTGQVSSFENQLLSSYTLGLTTVNPYAIEWLKKTPTEYLTQRVATFLEGRNGQDRKAYSVTRHKGGVFLQTKNVGAFYSEQAEVIFKRFGIFPEHLKTVKDPRAEKKLLQKWKCVAPFFDLKNQAQLRHLSKSLNRAIQDYWDDNNRPHATFFISYESYHFKKQLENEMSSWRYDRILQLRYITFLITVFVIFNNVIWPIEDTNLNKLALDMVIVGISLLLTMVTLYANIKQMKENKKSLIEVYGDCKMNEYANNRFRRIRNECVYNNVYDPFIVIHELDFKKAWDKLTWLNENYPWRPKLTIRIDSENDKSCKPSLRGLFCLSSKTAKVAPICMVPLVNNTITSPTLEPRGVK